MLHNTDRGVVGGAVDRSWMQYSLDQYDGYDPSVVLPESVIGNGTSATADLPFNNTATIRRSYMRALVVLQLDVC